MSTNVHGRIENHTQVADILSTEPMGDIDPINEPMGDIDPIKSGHHEF